MLGAASARTDVLCRGARPIGLRHLTALGMMETLDAMALDARLKCFGNIAYGMSICPGQGIRNRTVCHLYHSRFTFYPETRYRNLVCFSEAGAVSGCGSFFVLAAEHGFPQADREVCCLLGTLPTLRTPNREDHSLEARAREGAGRVVFGRISGPFPPAAADRLLLKSAPTAAINGSGIDQWCFKRERATQNEAGGGSHRARRRRGSWWRSSRAACAPWSWRRARESASRRCIDRARRGRA